MQTDIGEGLRRCIRSDLRMDLRVAYWIMELEIFAMFLTVVPKDVAIKDESIVYQYSQTLN